MVVVVRVKVVVVIKKKTQLVLVLILVLVLVLSKTEFVPRHSVWAVSQCVVLDHPLILMALVVKGFLHLIALLRNPRCLAALLCYGP